MLLTELSLKISVYSANSVVGKLTQVITCVLPMDLYHRMIINKSLVRLFKR